MIQIEHTDTYAGEANYCWAHRWHSDLSASAPQRTIVRLAKKLASLTGVRCRVESHGDDLAIYPRGICQVVFVSPVDPEYAQGTHVNEKGE